jgi:hypothetical protein
VAARSVDPAIATVDKFGLPTEWSLLAEREEEKAAREAMVENLFDEVLDVVAKHLGYERLHEKWLRFAESKPQISKKKKRGRPAHPDIDAGLLAELDRRAAALSPEAGHGLPAELARDVANRAGPGMCEINDRLSKTSGGTRAEAIEKRIGTALRKRSQQAADENLVRRVIRRRSGTSLLEF